MSRKKTSNVKNIFSRLEEYYNLPSDKALSEFLEVDYDVLMQWKRRGRLPRYDAFLLKCPGINTDFLDTGEGEMFSKPLNSNEKVIIAQPTDDPIIQVMFNLIKEFMGNQGTAEKLDMLDRIRAIVFQATTKKGPSDGPD